MITNKLCKGESINQRQDQEGMPKHKQLVMGTCSNFAAKRVLSTEWGYHKCQFLQQNAEKTLLACSPAKK